MKGQTDDPGVWSMIADPLGSFNAVHAGQANIHDHNMGAQFPEQIDRFLSVIALADHAEPRILIQYELPGFSY
jgi:hypothetical protein